MQYDVTIVGGGLVGAGLAIALQAMNLKVALIDAKLPTANDARLFALSFSSCQFLRNIQAWEALAAHACPIHQVHVSHKGRFGAVRLQREEMNIEALGYVIPAKHIEAALNAQLSTLAHLSIFRPAELVRLEQTERHCALTIKAAEKEIVIHSTLVIGADGTQSTVRKLCEIETETVDDQQAALVTRTLLKRSHQQVAYERFTEKGTIAMLPLAENECATIWSGEADYIAHLLTLSEEAFVDLLQKTFGGRLGHLQGIRERYHYPLRRVRAKQNGKDNIILLGNAADTLLPIAAQGFNVALSGAAMLVEAIQKQPILAMQDWQLLREQIRAYQKLSLQISNWLPKLVTNEFPLMPTLLQIGMLGLEKIPPFKRKFMRQMTGLVPNAPSLLMSNQL